VGSVWPGQVPPRGPAVGPRARAAVWPARRWDSGPALGPVLWGWSSPGRAGFPRMGIEVWAREGQGKQREQPEVGWNVPERVRREEAGSRAAPQLARVRLRQAPVPRNERAREPGVNAAGSRRGTRGDWVPDGTGSTRGTRSGPVRWSGRQGCWSGDALASVPALPRGLRRRSRRTRTRFRRQGPGPARG
jgi:hypothetical protein